MLKINNLNAYYGELQVLWDVSFKVEKGEIVSIVGANGAGKTTTLNAIMGLLCKAQGEIEFLGKRIDDLPTYKRVELGISLVPEGRQLFPYMTVIENLKLGAYTKEAYSKIDDTLEEVYQLFPRLKEREKQRAGTLSGGEQQMVAIGRALMSRPKLLMLDEPSLGLAPNLVAEIFNTIKKLNEAGTSILVVEQNVHDILEIADRGYVLENGKIIMEGEGEKLLKNEYLKKAYLGI